MGAETQVEAGATKGLVRSTIPSAGADARTSRTGAAVGKEVAGAGAEAEETVGGARVRAEA